MLSYTDSRADDTVLSSATDSDLITISRDAGRLANQAEARQVLAAYQLGVIRHRQMLELPMVTRFRNGGQKATVAKVSQQLGIPAHRAMMWIATGRRLDVLPQVRHAYLEGRFDTLRVRVIAEELAPLPDALRAELEPIALELADRPTTDQRLRHQLERLIITRAPDHATAAREEFSRNHSNVSVRDEAHEGRLSYKPSKDQRESVLTNDDTCRFPWCGKLAADCELDHVAPFDHQHPERGGQTTTDNLIPLCSLDHQRKHMGLWEPTLNPDRTVSWRDLDTGEVVVTHPR